MRRYSLILDGRTIELPCRVQTDDEAEFYASLALAASGRSSIFGDDWQACDVGRQRMIFARSSKRDASKYVGYVRCHETEPTEVDTKKTSDFLRSAIAIDSDSR